MNLSGFNSSSQSLKPKERARKQPSMIPRSKSRRRGDAESTSKLEIRSRAEEDRLPEKPPPEVKGISRPESKREEKKEGPSTGSLSLKSCQDFDEVPVNPSEMSYRDAVDKTVESVIRMGKGRDAEDERETRRQERTIKNLYDSIKETKWTLFEKLAAVGNHGHKVKIKNWKEDSIQGVYEYTLEEISDIWRNTISLMSSVKEHTLNFTEKKSKAQDKEQLALEAEMLQLAVDFAVNYSKLKTDFLIKSLSKRLNLKEFGKSDLENFMNSKTFAALYNDEDLAAMARTVQDLNNSVLKGSDIEFE